MRTLLIASVVSMMMICGCKKNNPANYSCMINSPVLTTNVPTLINGFANAVYNTTTGAFQVIMPGINSQSVVLTWFNIDSVGGVKSINGRSYYTNYQYSTPAVTGSYISQFNSGTYTTNVPLLHTGTITVVNNTGVGGSISGTFFFSAENSSYPYDTVNVSQGVFTNLPIVAE
jgi:hypothetical protein